MPRIPNTLFKVCALLPEVSHPESIKYLGHPSLLPRPTKSLPAIPSFHDPASTPPTATAHTPALFTLLASSPGIPHLVVFQDGSEVAGCVGRSLTVEEKEAPLA